MISTVRYFGFGASVAFGVANGVINFNNGGTLTNNLPVSAHSLVQSTGTITGGRVQYAPARGR